LAHTQQILPFVVSAVVVAVLLAVTLRRRREPAAPWFVATLVCLFVWTVGYILELSSVRLEAKLFWANVQFFGIVPLSVCWFLAVRTVVGAPPLPRWIVPALWAPCAALLAVIVVNPAGVFRDHPDLTYAGTLTMLHADYGAAYYGLLVPFQFGLLVAILVLLVRGAVHGQAAYRRRALLLLVATLLPMIAGSLYAAGLLPWSDYDPAMAVVTASVVLCACALSQYRLFDVAPLARDAVFEHLADAVMVLDGRGYVVDFNPSAERLFAALDSAALGQPVEEVLARHEALVSALHRRAPAGWAGAHAAGPEPDGVVEEAPEEAASDDVVVVVRLGDPACDCDEIERHFALALTPVTNRAGDRVGSAVVLHDVTRTVRLLSKVQHLASTDELTGLLTRRRFFALAEQELQRARRHGLPLTVLLCDLDRFKMVNDVYGHAVGDEVLRAVATMCRSRLRSFDLLGRFGGDELCAVLPHDGPGDAAAVAERLRGAVAGLSVWSGGTLVHTTVSIGVASVGSVGTETVQSLLEAADAALYEAKRLGRDRVGVRVPSQPAYGR
jgi:diguanylate cyclase (GGDEF)-like protein